uniref:Putative tail tape measure protein n=1 Tax=viral metagenome TaxID=1070528 RepID=A0A6H1ZEL1_9ZZZZ
MGNKVEIQIIGEDKASAVLKQVTAVFDKTTKGVSTGTTGMSRAWIGFTDGLKKGETAINNTIKRLTSMQGLLVTMAGGYGLVRLGKTALDVASSFEQMEVKLNALTRGRGKETLDALNEWALEMPVNTRKTVDTFAMMKAMGLDPTIASLQTLVDVAVLFGEDAMPRVARALGQMQALGRLSAEELNQLSEVGINARKYVTEAFGKTVEELQKMNVPIQNIISVIWKGLATDFGGAAKEAQRNWQGLLTTTQSYFEEIVKQVMEAGVFDELKNQLININNEMKTWIDNNRELIRIKVPEYVEKIKNVLQTIWDIISYDPAIIEWGLIGLAIGGKKWAIIAGGIAHMATWAENLGKALGMVAGGVLSIKDVAGANFKELEELVRRGEEIMQGPFFRGKIPARPKGVGDLPAPVPLPPPGLPEGYEKLFKQLQEKYHELQNELTLLDYEGWEKRRQQVYLWAKDTEEKLKATGMWTKDVQKLVADIGAKELKIIDVQRWQEQLKEWKEAWAAYADSFEVGIQDMVQKADDWTDRMSDAFKGWASNFSNMLTDVLFDAESTFSDIAKAFAKMITQMWIQWAIAEPLMGMFGGWFKDFFKSGKGNVFDSGNVQPMAAGGIIKKPTIFPMASGDIGLMGEAGPEAIMPLVRLPGGALGVRAKIEGASSQRGSTRIELINKSGIPLEATESRVSFNADEHIVQVWLDSYRRNRFGLREALGV